jgi:3-deoxy-D-arabino-heptulosonate 7-phosphate (DAHP) synthase
MFILDPTQKREHQGLASPMDWATGDNNPTLATIQISSSANGSTENPHSC